MAVLEIRDKFNIDVKPFEQQFVWSCGPSALRIVLYYQYGYDLTDRELSLLCGSTENGTDELNFEMGLTVMGFKYKQSNSGTLNKLKSLLAQYKLPIVHLVMQDGVGHYMVFIGYDAENVYLSDPATGKNIKYGISFFLGIWKEEEAETQTRWYLVVVGRSKVKIGAMISRLKHIEKKLK